MGSFLLSDMGISFQSQLKLEPFVILFSYNIIISVIIFVLIYLLNGSSFSMKITISYAKTFCQNKKKTVAESGHFGFGRFLVGLPEEIH